MEQSLLPQLVPIILVGLLIGIPLYFHDKRKKKE